MKPITRDALIMVQTRMTDRGHKMLQMLQHEELKKREAGDRISLSLIAEKILEKECIAQGLTPPKN